jgi:hypothetical protein
MAHKSIKHESVLARCLRDEAIAERPEFSPSLHRRAMSAIEQQRATTTRIQAAAASRDATAGHRKFRLAVVLAAAAMLAAVAIGVLPNAPRTPAGAPPIAASLADLPLPTDFSAHAKQGWDSLLVASGWQPQVEDLKHDARLAAEAMLSCLPHDIQVADNK